MNSAIVLLQGSSAYQLGQWTGRVVLIVVVVLVIGAIVKRLRK